MFDQTDQELIQPVMSWKASINLELAQRFDRTVISQYQHEGPLLVQKPFYPEGPVCHVYLLHPPGGIVGGDHLNIGISLKNDAHCLITTPAAGKFYRSDGRKASQQVNIGVDSHCSLEWFPQETILFDACLAATNTKIQLAYQANFIGWELTCFGRPASGEKFSRGDYKQQFELWRNNKPLLLERTHIKGTGETLHAHWGLNGFTVMATLIATPVNKDTLAMVRQGIKKANNELVSFSLIDDVFVCRYLGAQADIAKQRLIEVWKILRPEMMQRPICIPRIWAT